MAGTNITHKLLCKLVHNIYIQGFGIINVCNTTTLAAGPNATKLVEHLGAVVYEFLSIYLVLGRYLIPSITHPVAVIHD